jgi:ribosome-binding factor A
MARRGRGSGGRGHARRSGGARDYPRTARLNQLLREIIGEALEDVDDDRLEQVVVTAVDVDRDLRHATVFYDSLGGADTDTDVLAALGEARIRLQACIGREAHIKRVPELGFRPDPAVRAGEHIDEVLRDLPPTGTVGEGAVGDGAVGDGAAPDGAGAG